MWFKSTLQSPKLAEAKIAKQFIKPDFEWLVLMDPFAQKFADGLEQYVLRKANTLKAISK